MPVVELILYQVLLTKETRFSRLCASLEKCSISYRCREQQNVTPEVVTNKGSRSST